MLHSQGEDDVCIIYTKKTNWIYNNYIFFKYIAFVIAVTLLQSFVKRARPFKDELQYIYTYTVISIVRFIFTSMSLS